MPAEPRPLRVFVTDHHVVPLPDGHRFPMGKYRLLRETLQREAVLPAEAFEDAPLVDDAALLRVHERGYVTRVLTGTLDEAEVRRLGFPWSPELVTRCRASVGGTVAAGHAALEHGVAGNLAGGTHHAYHDVGAGYCVFNDIAVAARELLDRGRARRVLVVDLDVHQGDGTAALFADDDRVFTLSLHGARNFPARKQVSDLDVPLPDDTGDAAYLAALGPALTRALDASRPDVVFYQAGVDPLAQDKLGRLALTLDGLRARDEHVLQRLASAGLPVALTLGGGYAEPIEDSVRAHVQTYEVAAGAFRNAASG